MDKEEKQINIELKPEVAKGSYANLAIITHSRSEFIIDFATILPGLPKPEVQNRIVMAPEHCKRLLSALADNISKYEAQFGLIEMGSRKPQQDSTFNIADFNPNGTKS